MLACLVLLVTCVRLCGVSFTQKFCKELYTALCRDMVAATMAKKFYLLATRVLVFLTSMPKYAEQVCILVLCV